MKIWLAKNPRFHLHSTPTSSSWLSLVERWFRELTDKAISRGAFHSVPDLITAIEKYMEVHNDEPNPLLWTATAESLLPRSAAAELLSTKRSVNDETHHEAWPRPSERGCC